jgi:hypothetical protein
VAQGTEASRAVVRTIVALERAGVLPGAGDLAKFVSDPDEATAVRKLAHVRRVTGHNLWVWYWSTVDEVRFVAMTDEPP